MTQMSAQSIPAADASSTDETSRADIVTDLDALESLAPQWRALQREFAAPGSPFDPSRIVATLRALAPASSPHALVRWRGELASAMLIGRTDHRRIKCRIGYLYLPTPKLSCLNITYGGLMATSEADQSELAAHLRGLLDRGEVEHIVVSKLPLDHPMFGSLSSMRRSVVRERRPHWCADLVPNAYDETIERFERKDRYNRRKVRTMEKKLGDLELLVVTREDQIDDFIEDAAEVSSRSFQAALGAGFEDTPLWRSQLTASAKAGRLRCYLLRCAGEPVAYQVGSVNDQTYVLDAAAYDPQHRQFSPGTVLLILVIRDLCDSGFECLDYGFGDAPYKRQYGTRCWDECNIHIYGRSLRARLTCLIDRFGVFSAKGMKRLAGSGVAQRLRKSWRQRLERTS